MMLLNPYVWLGAAAILVATNAASGLAGYRAGSTLKQAEWDAAVVARKSGEDAALKAAAEAIAKIEVTSETIIQPVRTEIRTNTVYRECVHSDGVMRNLNSLITGEESQPTGSGSVPATNTSR